MGKVILDMAMSVDGFIAGPNDDDRGLHTYFFAPTPETTKLIDAGIKTTGAMIMGRRTYDLGDHFDGFADTPYKVPHFVLSHTVPTKPAKGETAFTFVADGIESALRQAKAAAGDRAVVIGGGDIFLGAAPAAAILAVIRSGMTAWQGQLFGQIGLLITVIIVIRVLPGGLSGWILGGRK